MAEQLLKGEPFQLSQNEYDWLGEGVYFWEANPLRGLEFAREGTKRKSPNLSIKTPAVIGAVIDLGNCLDLTSSAGLDSLKDAFDSLKEMTTSAGSALPVNHPERLMHNLDCAVINTLHGLRKKKALAEFDSVKGIFIEGDPIYPGSEFHAKNHIQVAVRNPECIKGVFRVPKAHLDLSTKYTYTAVNDKGHRVGSYDGRDWFDLQTGERVV